MPVPASYPLRVICPFYPQLFEVAGTLAGSCKHICMTRKTYQQLTRKLPATSKSGLPNPVNVNLIFSKLRREIGPSALAAKLRKPLAAAASFDVAQKRHFWAEQVAEVVATEEEVRAPAPADDIEAAEIEANAHSVQPDIATRIATKPFLETTVILFDNVLPSTIKNPVHMSSLGFVHLRPASSNLTS
jgi:hypothetical protein